MLYKWTDFEVQDNVKRYRPASEHYLAQKARQKASREAKAKVQESLSKGHKLCTSCNQELSLDNFNVDKKTFTGYSTWCKACKKNYNKKYLKGNTNDQALGE